MKKNILVMFAIIANIIITSSCGSAQQVRIVDLPIIKKVPIKDLFDAKPGSYSIISESDWSKWKSIGNLDEAPILERGNYSATWRVNEEIAAYHVVKRNIASKSTIRFEDKNNRNVFSENTISLESYQIVIFKLQYPSSKKNAKFNFHYNSSITTINKM